MNRHAETFIALQERPAKCIGTTSFWKKRGMHIPCSEAWRIEHRVVEDLAPAGDDQEVERTGVTRRTSAGKRSDVERQCLEHSWDLVDRTEEANVHSASLRDVSDGRKNGQVSLTVLQLLVSRSAADGEHFL